MRIIENLLIGKFQDPNMSTVPSGSGNTCALDGNNSNGSFPWTGYAIHNYSVNIGIVSYLNSFTPTNP